MQSTEENEFAKILCEALAIEDLGLPHIFDVPKVPEDVRTHLFRHGWIAVISVGYIPPRDRFPFFIIVVASSQEVIMLVDEEPEMPLVLHPFT